MWSTHHKEAELMGVYIHLAPLLWHTDQQLHAKKINTIRWYIIYYRICLFSLSLFTEHFTVALVNTYGLWAATWTAPQCPCTSLVPSGLFCENCSFLIWMARYPPPQQLQSTGSVPRDRRPERGAETPFVTVVTFNYALTSCIKLLETCNWKEILHLNDQKLHVHLTFLLVSYLQKHKKDHRWWGRSVKE